MVTGKVTGLQRTSANPKPTAPRQQSSSSPTSTKLIHKGPSRSFGVYFPRSSAQVQPCPPQVPELLHQLEEMRQRESLLKTKFLELQKFKDSSASLVSSLENKIVEKDCVIKRSETMVACLGSENEKLRQEVEMLHCKLFEQNRENGERVKALEGKVSELSRMTKVDHRKNNQEVSKLQRFQDSVDVFYKPNIKKNGNVLEKFDYLEQPIREEKVIESEVQLPSCSEESVEFVVSAESRVPRIPRPPLRPNVTCSNALDCISSLVSAPSLLKMAPQPPPPPPKGFLAGAGKVRRVPEVVEFYQSLMRRDSRRDSGGGGTTDVFPGTANARNMIGEIENRSAYLLAIKSDVEMQGEFIRFLIKEVEDAKFTNIQDAVAFVKWLDDELSSLVDERAVLKHFQWPEKKADMLREAVFGYCDVNKLVSEASSFRDDPQLPFIPALKKMQGLIEKLENGAYNLSRTRELAGQRYQGFQIPIDWMLESGCTSQIKLASVKLATNYMKRVLAELEMVGGASEEEELIVEGVRFAFRVHQFAGGFDAETMKAFQHLRDKAKLCRIRCQNNQQKYACRSTAC